MSPVTTAPEARTAGAGTGVFALGRGWRKAILVVHVIAAGAWIGIDVLVAVLVSVGRFGSGVEVRGLAYRALAAFVVWPMLVSGLACLASGVLLGLGTRWGCCATGGSPSSWA